MSQEATAQTSQHLTKPWPEPSSPPDRTLSQAQRAPTSAAPDRGHARGCAVSKAEAASVSTPPCGARALPCSQQHGRRGPARNGLRCVWVAPAGDSSPPLSLDRVSTQQLKPPFEYQSDSIQRPGTRFCRMDDRLCPRALGRPRLQSMRGEKQHLGRPWM